MTDSRSINLRAALAWLGVAMLVAVATSGCGSGKRTYTVNGTVRFQDQSPLRKGQVIFQGQGLSAYGDIQDDGTFTMGTYGEEDGVPAGKYTVFLGGDLYASLPDFGESTSSSPDHGAPTSGKEQLLVDPSMCGPGSGIAFQVEPHHRNVLEIVAKRPSSTR